VPDQRIVPLLLDYVDHSIPLREARIAYCRDQLLTDICSNVKHSLYIPIDLDLNLACLLSDPSFRSLRRTRLNGRAFPSRELIVLRSG